MSEHPAYSWAMVIGSIVTAVFGFVGYAFSTFETRSQADDARATIERRLERIEAKIDSLMMRK